VSDKWLNRRGFALTPFRRAP